MRGKDQNTGKIEANEYESRKKGLVHRRLLTIYLIVYDIIAINVSYFLGLWLRFDLHFTQIPREYLSAYARFAPVYTLFAVLIFTGLSLYRSLWKFASYSELNRILGASALTTLFHIVGITALERRMPASYYIIGPVIQIVLVTGVRFGYRFISLERSRRSKHFRAVRNAMIIGAGDAGQIVLRELLKSTKSDAKPVCLIDDDADKWGCLLEGVPVAGGRDSILLAVEKYKVDQILFAIPTASAQTRRDVLNICKETGCELMTLPGIYQLALELSGLAPDQVVHIGDSLQGDALGPAKLGIRTIWLNTEGRPVPEGVTAATSLADALEILRGWQQTEKQ